jgi:hypothetical protein
MVNKDKKLSNILKYRAKPSKNEYKDMIGWFYANNIEENEHLKHL